MTDTRQLVEALYHPEERRREEAVAGLRAAGAAALEPLIAVLSRQFVWPRPRRVTGLLGLGPNPAELEREARRRAAGLLGELDDPRAADALLAATRDPEELVRHSAALALGKRPEARAVEPLLEALGSFNADIRADAAEALGRQGDRRAVDALIRVMQVDGQPGPRWMAMRALGQLGDRRAVQPILHVMEALLTLPAVDWAPPNRHGYEDDEPVQVVWTTCTTALEVLEKLGDPAALPAIERLASEAPARSIATRAARTAERLRQKTG